MKKSAILSILACMAFVPALAQQLESGSLKALKGEKQVNLKVDFVSIHSMDEKSFGEYEQDWFKDKSEVLDIIADNANKKLKNVMTLGYSQKAKYTVTVIVNSINRKGNYECDAVVTDQDGGEIAKITGIKGKGGTFGTKLNLIKDGAGSTGKKVGEILKSELKKIK